RNAGLVRSHRGPDGGWTLGRRPEEIPVADVIRVLEGPMASVRGIRPHELLDDGVEEPYVALWVATRVAVRSLLDEVTIAHLAAGTLPRKVTKPLDAPGAWTAS